VRSEQFQYIAKAVPLSRLFCETDSPFLSPFQDKPNEPAFVVEAYKKVAAIKGLELEEARNIIFSNWQRVF
jgi:TatD DNase family protein